MIFNREIYMLNAAVRSRRLFVSGGSRLSSESAMFLKELGRLLAEEDGLTIITGEIREAWWEVSSHGSFPCDGALCHLFKRQVCTRYESFDLTGKTEVLDCSQARAVAVVETGVARPSC
jgi:hypothetical protein